MNQKDLMNHRQHTEDAVLCAHIRCRYCTHKLILIVNLIMKYITLDK